MSNETPGSVLFCCDHNAIRSPMAEGLMKHLCGQKIYIQSAGVYNDLEIDGFAIAVCGEKDVELSRHQSRSFDEMQTKGDDLAGFDLVIALSKLSFDRATELARFFHLDVEYWSISDPTTTTGNRENRLAAYRVVRDEINERLRARFGADCA